jgi:hypothetical protein
METLRPLIGRLPFDVEIEELDEGDVLRGEGFRIVAFPTRHSIPSVGYALVEDLRPGAFDVDAARALGVTPGPDFGVLQRGGEVVTPAGRTVRPDDVLGGPRAGRRVVVSGDTEPCDATREIARGASVLVHEGLPRRGPPARPRDAPQHRAQAATSPAGRRRLWADLTRCCPRTCAGPIGLDRVLVPRDDQIEIPFPAVPHRPPGPGGRRAAADGCRTHLRCPWLTNLVPRG